MHPDLIVIYTNRLDACHAFYVEFGLTCIKEQHGPGPSTTPPSSAEPPLSSTRPARTARPPGRCASASPSPPAPEHPRR